MRGHLTQMGGVLGVVREGFLEEGLLEEAWMEVFLVYFLNNYFKPHAISCISHTLSCLICTNDPVR